MTLEGTIRHGMTLSAACVSDAVVIAFGPIGSYVDLSGYYTKTEIDGKGYLTEHQDISGKADKATTYTKSEVDTALSGKQATLVSGTNIKTINNQSLLGSGNIDIQGGGGDMSNYYTKSETNSLLGAKQNSLSWDATPTEDSANPVTSGGLYTKFLYVEADLAGKASSADLASVATSGSYNDLSDKPEIPQAQVQSDWNESDSSKVDYIKNKPTIPAVPTNVSAFTNDVGYLTQHQSLADYYTKTEVDTVLGEKANSADLASVATSGSYNDLSNKPTIPTVPSNVSAFNNDAGYLTTESDPTVPSHVKSITQQNINNWNGKVDSGDLANYYTKSEIDSTIGDIETLLTNI